MTFELPTMFLLLYLTIFFIGLAVGSFLNVVIDRIPRGESIMNSRSHCEHCRHTLHWLDLIPIVSFVLQRGKCRYCKKHISSYYPLVEGVTAVLFIFIAFFILDFLRHYSDLRYILTVTYLFYIVSSLIVIFFTDIKYGIIPFKVVFYAILVAALWHIFSPSIPVTEFETRLLIVRSMSFFNYLLSAFGAFGAFLLLFIGTKQRGLGFGDVVFAFLMGFLLGFPKIVLGLYIAFLSGALLSTALVVVGRKKMRGGVIPFGPFLVGGTIISLIWGNTLITLILSYLLSR